MLNRLILFFLNNGVVVAVFIIGLIAAGVAVMPFDTPFDGASFRDRVPVDAIPDISENQVIVAADWPGRTPQDVEDQVTYPLSTALQGIPRVVDIRGISGFGMSRIYVVFDDGVDFYWARSRVLEKLATIGGGMPEGVTPSLGPDATALGQIFWYSIDGPGKSFDELRAVQDFEVRYALQAVHGVAEVASVGGQVREYQINFDPQKLRSLGLTIPRIATAIKQSNLDVGATTINQGGNEFLIRGIGFVRSLDDVRRTLIATHDDAPVRLQDVGQVTLGPAFRRGALADETGERVGGVVAMRFGANPKVVIDGVKEVIAGLNRSLASRGMAITPFYDRTQLIDETLGTLTEALIQELLVTVVVVLLFLLHVRTSLIVATTLPLAVLMSFVAMKLFGIDSNIMSLAGIAIAIGVMVDIGIVMSENAYNYLLDDGGKRPPREPVGEAAIEVAGALMTAVGTTVVGFLPVFFLTGQEGKLFAPLAWTKTFCMIAAVVISIVLVPLLCRLCLPSARGGARRNLRRIGVPIGIFAVMALVAITTFDLLAFGKSHLQPITWALLAGVATGLLLWRASRETLTSIDQNPVSRFILALYRPTLRWVLRHKLKFLCIPLLIVLLGLMVWRGAGTVLTPIIAPLEATGVDPDRVRPIRALKDAFPGLGQEFMPPLDEGTLLYMPSLLPQASLDETLRVMVLQNQAIRRVPEVTQVMGKLGRAESPLDPAPVGMIETVVNLRPRSQWRPGITVDDIVADLKGQCAQAGVQPSWLQPIETRVVMLQSGIKAQMALKAYGTDPVALERFCVAAEAIIKQVPGATDVTAQRSSSKPYLEFKLDRTRLAYHGVDVKTAANVIQLALGDMPLTTTVEGRERYAIRVRYPRELRSRIDQAGEILVPTGNGGQVPIRYLADIEVRLGPAMILTENGFVWSYVNFNAKGRDAVSVVENARARIDAALAAGTLVPPAGMTKWEFAGTYKNQQRAASRLAVLIPVAIFIILFLLYLHFRDAGITLLVFSGLPVAVAGGFIFIALWPGIEQLIYAVDHAVLGGTYPVPGQEPVYLTVAVWVGFIALFGIAIDDGVVIGTYIQQVMAKRQPKTKDELHAAVMEAGSRRIRPALMTSFTTLVALVPVLWATGRGSDVARPMALPVFGGMVVALITILVVPCVFTLFAERKLAHEQPKEVTS